jgi:hypothetical protein
LPGWRTHDRAGVLTRKGAIAFFSAVAVLLTAAYLLLFGGSSADTPGVGPGSDASSATAPPGSGNLPAVHRGPLAPATGALLGAWVKPDLPTQSGTVDAVSDFESSLGRPLDIVQVYHQWGEDFPSPADVALVRKGRTLLLSWSGTDTRLITSGRFDTMIRQRAEEVKALGVPILLRWRWEMNRPNLQGSIWTPADFVAAWKHIRAIFTEVGATNAGWVWCPIATDFDATDGPAYYPGDDQVEWLCEDVYPGPDYDSFATVSNEFMSWAEAHRKPVIIGEFGAEDKAPGQRKTWFADAFEYVVAHPQIKALVYFDARRADSSGRVRDFTLQPRTGPMEEFQSMALNPYFDRRLGGS